MPQVKIQYKSSDDPRDTLIAMLTGESMPGVRDGYCRIERYPGENGFETAVITPIDPVEMVKHIPLIGEYAFNSPVRDTAEVPSRYFKIIEGEYKRLSPVDAEGIK